MAAVVGLVTWCCRFTGPAPRPPFHGAGHGARGDPGTDSIKSHETPRPVLSTRPRSTGRMAIADRYQLLHGPYRMPRCQPGDVLVCAIRGPVAVHSISSGRTPWPRTRVCGKYPLIVC